MSSRIAKARPKNLNLTTIRLPLPALVSILHRASGFLLFLALPLLLWVLQQSLQSSAGFQQVLELAAHPLSKLLLLGLAWAFLHHFLAGLRHLAMDVRWGIELAQARLTGKLVLAGGLLLTIWLGVKLW
jgi:succinate dehydrogenase / fumarate reductase cytochrome b subunit